jgi:cob(I)alamin adenosyltransferase
MKIYTKTGDKGQTSLLSGERTPKFDLRIKAYGTVDELSSFIGLLAALEFDINQRSFLYQVQTILYFSGSHLAVRGKTTLPMKNIKDHDIKSVEQQIDLMNEQLPELKHFIIPGGSKEAAFCHICRSICRRAEREVVELSEKEKIDANIIIYLNRLSDYFFVLSRLILHYQNIPEVLVKN